MDVLSTCPPRATQCSQYTWLYCHTHPLHLSRLSPSRSSTHPTFTLPSHVIMTATDIYKGASSEQAQSKRAQTYDNQHNQSLSRPTTQSQRARINTSPRGRLSSSFYIPNILTPFSCLCLSSDFVRISAAMSVVPTKVRETMPSMTC
jgi:hypothetical protein